MRKLFLSATLFAACVCASPVLAQWTGTRTGPKPANVPDKNWSKDDLARYTMREFSRCVIGISRTRVIEYLATFPNSEEANKIANNLSRNDCLAAERLSFDERLFRWTAYEVLYAKDFSKFELTKIATIPETDYIAMAKGLDAEGYQTIAILQLGECTVRAAPNLADTLVKSPIASKVETDSIKAIVPHISGCVNENNQIKFSKAVIRGVMAEALHKIATKAEAADAMRGSN